MGSYGLDVADKKAIPTTTTAIGQQPHQQVCVISQFFKPLSPCLIALSSLENAGYNILKPTRSRTR